MANPKAQVDSLLKRDLYDAAIDLAKENNIKDIHKMRLKYGDYLYTKGDFENAAKQYIETINYIEPSYVIKKFVDGSRMPQLRDYLENLHFKKASHNHHSMLLLDVYIKLNNRDKIISFIDQVASSTKFNVSEAVQILRADGLNDIALKLAKKYELNDQHITILVEDLKLYPEAIAFIKTQPIDAKSEFLIAYGAVLVKHDEDAIIGIIKGVYAQNPESSKDLIRIIAHNPKNLEKVFENPEGEGLIQPKDPKISIALLEQLVSKLTTQEKKDPQKLDELYDLITPQNVLDAVQIGRQYNVPALVVHVYRKTKKTEDLLRYLLQEGDLENVIEVCDDRVLKDMWIELITHVSRKSDLKTDDLMKLLTKARSSNFVHPLVVLEILARNDSLKVADILDYIVDWLETQSKYIKKNEELIEKNEREVEEMDKKADDLEHGVQVFSSSKCSVCDTALNAPSIHFVCQHSFHKTCFDGASEGKDSCPVCFADKEEDTVRTEQSISHLMFQLELQNADDAISLIADYIAKGAFDA